MITISVQMYGRVREGKGLCSPLGSPRVLSFDMDADKTHGFTSPAPEGCSSYSDHKEQSLQCRDPPVELQAHTESHTGLVHSGHTNIILLSKTPVK